MRSQALLAWLGMLPRSVAVYVSWLAVRPLRAREQGGDGRRCSFLYSKGTELERLNVIRRRQRRHLQ
jgi:hypothetical protein